MNITGKTKLLSNKADLPTGPIGRPGARLGNLPADYQRFGINPGPTASWEHGMRTNGSPGSYEWWYFDTQLEDGTKIVLIFYTKFLTEINGPLSPAISINISRPDGTSEKAIHYFLAKDFFASKHRCEIQIGKNTISEKSGKYFVHLELPEFSGEITYISTLPAWRPGTGHLLFGSSKSNNEDYFAWLVGAPKARVEAAVKSSGDIVVNKTGVGYHDHNWGNCSPLDLMNNWYWARAEVGSYTVIACRIISEQKFSYEPITLCMIAHNNKIIADGFETVKYSSSDVHVDPFTKKPVAHKLTFTVSGTENEKFIFQLIHEKDLFRDKLIDQAHGLQAFLGKLTGFDGAYIRFSGNSQLQRYHQEKLIDRQSAEAIWELMHFGHVKK